MPDATLRVILCGAGWVSQHHVRAWAKVAHARIVAVCDPDLGRAQERAEQTCMEAGSAPAVHPDLASALAATPADVVDIAAPMDAHDALVRTAADAGIAVICQKPLAPTAARAHALVAAVADRVRFVVHENWRFRAPYRRMHAHIAAGRIGRPVQFAMTYVGSGHSPASGSPPAGIARQPYMARLRRLIVYETLIHHLDTLTFLVGPLGVDGARLSRTSPAVQGEDGASVLLSGDGVHGTLTASTVRIGAPARAVDGLTILGTTGTVSFDGTTVTLDTIDGQRATEAFDPDSVYQGSYDAAIAHYAQALRSGGPFESGVVDHLRILDMAEAIYRDGDPGVRPARD